MSSTRGYQINDQLFFEMILLEIRGKTISYAAYKKKQSRQKENELRSEIKKVEDHHTINENDLVFLEAKKELRQQKNEGMIVRSKIKWIQEGLQNIFATWKKETLCRNIYRLLKKKMAKCSLTRMKLWRRWKIFVNFFYESREKDVVDVNLHTMVEAPTLSSEEKESLEDLFLKKRLWLCWRAWIIRKALALMASQQSSIRFFWKDIGHFLVRSINYGFRSGEMSITQKGGIITRIPKEDKPKQFLRNWRHTSYKIASWCIAARIKTVLPKIIHNNQKGFMKGRYIGENLRLLYGVLVYTNFYKKLGLLLAVDFEKAFDRVAWSFIKKSLHRFNFGPDIKWWVQIFYTNIKASVSVNSQYTSWFQIERGVRQGDLLSSYLYLICAEIMSLMIRQNPRIKGILVKDISDFFLSLQTIQHFISMVKRSPSGRA